MGNGTVVGLTCRKIRAYSYEIVMNVRYVDRPTGIEDSPDPVYMHFFVLPCLV